LLSAHKRGEKGFLLIECFFFVPLALPPVHTFPLALFENYKSLIPTLELFYQKSRKFNQRKFEKGDKQTFVVNILHFLRNEMN